MTDSSRPQSEDPPPPHVVDGWLTAIHKRLDERRARCEAIAETARSHGLDCDWILVNKHLQWFELWHAGGLATGYLMGRTGVQYRQRSIEHWSE